MADPLPDLRAMRILVVDDEESIRFALTACLEADGHRVVSCGTADAAVTEVARRVFDLIFLDVRLGTQNGIDHIPALLAASPWARIVVITAYASIETAVEAIKAGATDYLAKPFDNAQLRLVTRQVAERRQLERKVDALERALGAMDPEADLPTASPAWREAIELARRVAPTNASVLIRGEGGTGRGRLARAVHAWSWRSAGPFAAVCCRGKTVDAIESELFGGDGADGGVDGAVARAHGGTLLIEEVADLPMRLQPRLVLLVRDRELDRPGAAGRRGVDVRVVATLDGDPYAAVAAGRLREDLLAAVGTVQVAIPPLRQRPEDIPLVAERYLAHFAREHHRPAARFSRDAATALAAHAWPGNTRELRTVVERAVLRCDAGATIELHHLPADLLAGDGADARPALPAVDEYRLGDLVPLDVIEASHIRRVLTSAKSIRRAAAILGINAATLCRKLKRLRTAAADGAVAGPD